MKQRSLGQNITWVILLVGSLLLAGQMVLGFAVRGRFPTSMYDAAGNAVLPLADIVAVFIVVALGMWLASKKTWPVEFRILFGGSIVLAIAIYAFQWIRTSMEGAGLTMPYGVFIALTLAWLGGTYVFYKKFVEQPKRQVNTAS